MPGTVPVELFVARTTRVAVFLASIAAYPQGFEVTVETAARSDALPGLLLPGGFNQPPDPAPIIAFWVRFADDSVEVRYGPSSGNSSEAVPFPRVGAGPRGSVVGVTYGPAGANGGIDVPFRHVPSGPLESFDGVHRHTERIWVSPLPPPGPVTFLAACPSRDLTSAEVSIDASVVHSAAQRAVEVLSPAPTPPGTGQPPADPATAATEVRDAFARAFTGGQDVDAVLAAVQDGPRLRDTLLQARANQPVATRTSRPLVGEIVFLSPTRAAVEFQLAYSGAVQSGTRIGFAVLDDGNTAWQVSRETYCGVLSWTGARCPPA
ncbi:hypothetical protein [Frankia canadensis]|uniref:hypothetical protein n=1 Tax=Frankia canadensis TaxID=1836972 RepID=UPI0010562C5A|nr:hypothetical protein [Frankia canadensis]